MNPFSPQKGPIDKLKRNVYDLSFTSHITANFGTLYPVFCKKVSPGDSMSIDTTFGLRAQPMIFPVQTKMRADIHYFYVRNRTLWNNFMDFYGKTKEGVVHPYIEQPPSAFKTGSIYDYLGVPTTIMDGSYFWDTVAVNPYDPFHTAVFPISSLQVVSSNQLSMSNSRIKFFDYINRAQFPYTSNMWVSSNVTATSVLGADISPILTENTTRIGQITGFFPLLNSDVYASEEFVPNLVFPNSKGLESFKDSPLFCMAYFFVPNVEQFSNDILNGNYNPNITEHHGTMRDIENDFELADSFGLIWKNGTNECACTLKYSSDYVYIDLGENFKKTFEQADIINNLRAYQSQTGNQVYYCLLFYVPGSNVSLTSAMSRVDEKGALLKYNDSDFVGFGNVCRFMNYADTIVDSSTLSSSPWCGSDKQLKINALPYRAYEAIYNSFYRNTQVSPFKINGQPEYNKYVTNLNDGADSFPYKLYQRNYEFDFLTGAFHSPQQGEAPLIGLTVNNKDQTAIFKFSSSQINNGATITATTSINDDGEVIGITGYDPNLPQSNIDRLMTAINYGISINDIRQTNGLQKWLEKNIRRGYRYKDQLMSHFGVSPSFSELLMPEFIGGVSQEIKTDTIYQMATNENGYLGDFAGRAGVAGSSEHRVSKFCDEAGFIIGIMSIVPTPVYSQVPAGYAFDNNLFDYFFPEFSKIGMQPIYNYQVTPLQSRQDLNGVFGYQRPYWDLIRSIDEVHGEFRTTANGYVIQRHFADTPELNQHFTEINKDSMTDVFMITDQSVSNQFLGMIHFNCKRKTAIPMFGIPSIE